MDALTALLNNVIGILTSVLSFVLTPLILLLSKLDFITPLIDELIKSSEFTYSPWIHGLAIFDDLFDASFLFRLFGTIVLFLAAYWVYRVASAIVRAVLGYFHANIWGD
jgi:hypothetical protein|nr:MAG TPA: hypothetical protein [Inoviridae sp.]